MPKLPKMTSLLLLCNILKNWVMKLIFWQADKHERLLQIDSIILMGMAKHSQSSQNSKFAMSLQYLKKEVKSWSLFFCMPMNIKVSLKFFSTPWVSKVSCNVGIMIINGHDQASFKLVLCFLMEVTRHAQNTQNRKLVIFFDILRKTVETALCSIVMQSIQIFYGGPVMSVVTYFERNFIHFKKTEGILIWTLSKFFFIF